MLTQSGPFVCPWPLSPGGWPEGLRSLARVVLSSLDLTGPRVCHQPCWWVPVGLLSWALCRQQQPSPGPDSRPRSLALLPRGAPTRGGTWPSLPSPFLGTTARGGGPTRGGQDDPKYMVWDARALQMPLLLKVSSVDDGHTAPSQGSRLFLSSWF